MFQMTKIKDIKNEISGLLTITLNNSVLLESEYIENFLLRKYGDYYFQGNDFTDFLYDWNCFVFLQAQNLKRIIDSYYSEYNPISNYDSNITETTIYGAKNYVNGEKQITDTSKVAPFESETFLNNAQNTSTENEYTNVEEEHTDTRTYKQTGNIGVTTSQQMIESELELRLKNVYYEFLMLFVNEYLFYVE